MEINPGSFSRGMMMMWSTAFGPVPGGWHICDGTSGTLNLQNYFIVGAGGLYGIGTTGGTTTHAHTYDADTNNEYTGAVTVTAAGAVNVAQSPHTHLVTGTTDTSPTLPPYYALYIIMKL